MIDNWLIKMSTVWTVGNCLSHLSSGNMWFQLLERESLLLLSCDCRLNVFKMDKTNYFNVSPLALGNADGCF